MKKLRASIIEQFLDPSSEYTIHQISKTIGKSYGSVHAEILEMAKQDIFSLRTIGHSTLVSFNQHSIENEEIMAYFVFNSYKKRKKFVDKGLLDKNYYKNPKNLVIIFYQGKNHFFSYGKQIAGRGIYHKLDDLKSFVFEILANEFVILKGAEIIWRVIA